MIYTYITIFLCIYIWPSSIYMAYTCRWSQYNFYIHLFVINIYIYISSRLVLYRSVWNKCDTHWMYGACWPTAVSNVSQNWRYTLLGWQMAGGLLKPVSSVLSVNSGYQWLPSACPPHGFLPWFGHYLARRWSNSGTFGKEVRDTYNGCSPCGTNNNLCLRMWCGFAPMYTTMSQIVCDWQHHWFASGTPMCAANATYTRLECDTTRQVTIAISH